MTPRTTISQLRNFTTTSSGQPPILLIALCFQVAVFISLPQGASAGYFRPTERTSFGSASETTVGYGYASAAARNRVNNYAVEEDELETTALRPQRADNIEFFETPADAALEETQGEAQEEFFDVDATDFPTAFIPTSSLAPTISPAPTINPTTSLPPTITRRPTKPATDAPSTAPNTPTNAPSIYRTTSTTVRPAIDPSSAPSEAEIDLAPLRASTGPTVVPTLVKREETFPTRAPTAAPTTPQFVSFRPSSGGLVPTTSPTVEQTVSQTPIYTWSPTNEGEFQDTLSSLIFSAFEAASSATVVPSTAESEGTTVTDELDTLLTYTDTPEAPTFSPTTTEIVHTTTTPREGEFPVAGQVSLHLQGIGETFPADTRAVFLLAADEFVSSYSTGTVDQIRVMLIYQMVVDPHVPSNDGTTRRLQAADVLQVDLGVEGSAHEETFSASEWNNWLQELFEKNSIEFVVVLKELGDAEGNSFFVPLEAIAVAVPEPVVIPTASPSKTVQSPTLVATTPSNEGGEVEGLSLGTIVGAAVGGFIFLVAGVLLIRYVFNAENRKRSASSQDDDNSAEHRLGTATESDEAPPRNSRPSNNVRSLQPSSSSESYLTNGWNSATRTASGPSESDNASQMGGTITGDMSQMDNASYAYSLEPGIDPSVSGVPLSVAASTSYSAYPGGGSSVASGLSSLAFAKLPISKSRSGGGIAGKPTRDVLAPPGKLGIIIDTTLEGPVVHQVNVGSALEGKIKSGDIIVAIDGVDTRAMTAASITALMVKTGNQRRKLTVVSP